MSDTDTLIVSNDDNRRLFFKKSKCDKYDYLIATGCGAIGGIIDIFLVGNPGENKLGKWTDEKTDGAVKKFAKLSGWKPKESQQDNVKSAIGFLEKKFPVNYDQRHSGDVNFDFKMSPKNHHMKSLGHSPDIVGLFFSVLNQFTDTSAFISNGKLIMIKTDTFELQGGNLVSKIFCGIANWFGHIMSDIAGSSGSTGRGSGVVMPFYEFFGFCKFGNFQVDNARYDLAQIAEKAFEEGYDFRHGVTMAIPVLITELSIRLCWSLKQCFYHKKPIKECVPTQKNDSLRLMLIVGYGVFCALDGIDAFIKSDGNILGFFLRLNLIAWFRFMHLVLKEIFIRLNIKKGIEKTIDAFKIINIALNNYIMELQKIDIDSFKKEVINYENTMKLFDENLTDKEFNILLKSEYKRLGIEKSWTGDFNEFMSNKNERLVFK